MLDSGPIAKICGHAFDPLDREDLWEKFASCTARTHTRQESRQLFDMLQSVDALRSARDLPTCGTIFTEGRARRDPDQSRMAGRM